MKKAFKLVIISFAFLILINTRLTYDASTIQSDLISVELSTDGIIDNKYSDFEQTYYAKYYYNGIYLGKTSQTIHGRANPTSYGFNYVWTYYDPIKVLESYHGFKITSNKVTFHNNNQEGGRSYALIDTSIKCDYGSYKLETKKVYAPTNG